ncbi:unnamed protein product [Moneuplotes crassus]|uniref:Uncharacterized protein n=1 Tax=Euplotes crassus TaxID=5936 RepID=A0AAD1XY96_EUPCR|nr:unnamed protein product [Moneuplotes crassus]
MSPPISLITPSTIFYYTSVYPVRQKLRPFHIFHYILEVLNVLLSIFMLVLVILIYLGLYYILFFIAVVLQVLFGFFYVNFPLNIFVRNLIVRLVFLVLGIGFVAYFIYYVIEVLIPLIRNINHGGASVVDEWVSAVLGVVCILPVLYFCSIFAIFLRRLCIAKTIKKEIQKGNIDLSEHHNINDSENANLKENYTTIQNYGANANSMID